MKLPAIFIALLLSTFCVLAQDKNELKVKINHEYLLSTNEKNSDALYYTKSNKPTIQFNYNTKEILQITNVPENFHVGIFLKRNEVEKFKKLMEKMLKFSDAVYENKITGVKKKFEDKSLLTSLCDRTEVNIAEDADPTKKNDIEVVWQYRSRQQPWNYAELQELAKFFDAKQKEVFKKYDLLKALND